MRGEVERLRGVAEEKRLYAQALQERAEEEERRGREREERERAERLEAEQREREEARALEEAERERLEEEDRREIEARKVASAEVDKERTKEEERRRRAAIAARRKKELLEQSRAKLTVERTELGKHSQKLDYSALGMSSLPPIVFTDPLLIHIRILWLNQNDFETLPPEIGRLQELTQLRVFQNHLRALPGEIGRLGKLQILWLQDNLLTTLPKQIENLTSLTMLSVKSNPLKVLPVELSRLKKVRSMELSTENVTFPPTSISVAGTRRVLDFLRRADRAWSTNTFDLSNLELETIPLDIITLFPSVDRLYVNSNPITRIPFDMHVMTQLTELRFDQHIMESPSLEIWSFGLPKTLEFMKLIFDARLARAPRFDFTEWSLTEIPAEVLEDGLSGKITKLDLTLNLLDKLPREVGLLTSLEELVLDRNHLRHLPRHVCQLSAMTRLSVVSNRLADFPDYLGTMVAIKTLCLGHNEIAAFPPSIVAAVTLESVDLSDNRILSFCEGLPKLTRLRVLRVANNGIEKLPFEFGVFTGLQQLDVAGNPIWSPPDDILKQSMGVWFSYLDRLKKSQQKLKATVENRQITGGRLDLRNFRLTQFVPEVPKMLHLFVSLTEINMDSNMLTTLPRSISKLTNLTSISFARNSFRTCPQVLGKCSNLVVINFEKNSLTFLPIEIGNLTALKKLAVEGNVLTQPPMEVVKQGIPSIIRFLKTFAEASGSGEVAMQGCSLKAFPLAVADLDVLHKVDLSHNFIGNIPNEFLQRDTVKFLDLSYNNLDKLEDSIRAMARLHTLNVSGNRIAEVPEAILSLTALRNLNMNQNLLSSLPGDLGTMSRLVELRVSNNRIDALPMSLGRMASLTYLNAGYNDIEQVPPTIGHMTSLTELSLVDNLLSSIPPIMGIMTALKEFNLYGNPLVKHPPEVVEVTMKMQLRTRRWHDGKEPITPLSLWLLRTRTARITKDFDASRFRLAVMPQEVLNLTSMQLVYLNLDRNFLAEVPPEIALLSTLTHIDLSHNKLRTLPTSIGVMTSLTLLYLNNNNITRLPIEIGHLSSTVLRRLAISHNKLETPPPELLTQATANILRYYSTSEVAILTHTLNWSWTKTLVTMHRVVGEVTNWQSLVRVYLEDNELSEISVPLLLAMYNLETLEIARNRVSELPKDLSAHSTLSELGLAQNRIKSIPIEFGSMRSMQRLDLTGLALTFPPQDILAYGTENILCYLAAMQQAYSDNVCIMSLFDLGTVAPEVLVLDEITTLELDSNRLHFVPEELSEMTNLTRLTFNDNKVSEVPVAYSRLTNLTVFEMERNTVQVLEPELCSLTSLTWLAFKGNPIWTPPAAVLKTCLPKETKETVRMGGGSSLAQSLLSVSRGGQSVLPGGRMATVVQQSREGGGNMSPLMTTLTSHSGTAAGGSLTSHSGQGAAPGVESDSWATADGGQTSPLGRLRGLPTRQGSMLSLTPQRPQPTPGSLATFRVANDFASPEAGADSFDVSHLGLPPSADGGNWSPGLGVGSVETSPLMTAGGPRSLMSVRSRARGGAASLTRSMASSSRRAGKKEEDKQVQEKPPPDTLLSYLKNTLAARSVMTLELPDFALQVWPLEAKNVAGISSLSLHNNRLGAIGEEVTLLTSLQLLRLDNNKINQLPDFIGNLTTLTSFSASKNLITEVPTAFSCLCDLTSLDLRDNNIPVLCVEMFRCTKLEVLLLDKNKLTELPPEFGDLRSLKTLSYEFNPVIVPPDEIRLKGLTSMLKFYDLIIMNAPPCSFAGLECDFLGTELNLDDFGLKELPDVVFRGMPRPGGSWDDPPHRMRRDRWAFGMTHLTKLSLQHNELGSVPELISRMHCVQALYLRGNKLTKLPRSVNGMKKLVVLDLRENRLEMLPDTISEIDTLEQLLLDNNEIKTLPNRLGYLPKLRSIECSNNSLIDLPMDLCQTPSIRVLNVDGNPLRMPPNEVIERGMRAIFDFLGRLFRCQTTYTLDLRTLGMETVDYSILPVPVLKRLLLANNKLTSLANEASDEAAQDRPGTAHSSGDDDNRLGGLEYLNADSNLLDAVPPSIIALTALTEISLQYNKIVTIPDGMYQLSKLRRLNVAYNQITQLPLDFGLLRTTIKRLDLDGNSIEVPTPEIGTAGVPIILQYLEDLHYSKQSLRLELRGLVLEAVPPEVLDATQLTRLVLDYNLIGEIPMRLCMTMTSLTTLWMCSNQISKIPRELCENCTSLVSLRLSDNLIVQVPLQIGLLTSLEEIMLQGNRVTILPLEIGKLLKVEKLALDVPEMVSPAPEICSRGTRITLAFLKAIFTARSSTVVDVRALGLTTFPVEIYTLTKITSLRLDDNHITALPPSLERLTDLTELTITNLQIAQLPFVLGSITGLTNLRLSPTRSMTNPPYEIVMQGTEVLLRYMRKAYLCVRSNGYFNVSNMSLENLPEEILQLGNMKHMQARNNHIMFLSPSIGKMNSIEEVHLHRNNILYLPVEVGRLVTLVTLRLPFNRLRVLPVELGRCFNLRKLSLQNNLLATVPPQVLAGLSTLRNLNIGRNQIVLLPPTIGEMGDLQKLRLDQNQLRDIPMTIGNCTSLCLLSITCNQVSTIPDTFAKCTNMTALHMSSNRFRQLPRCIDSLRMLRLLWAANNELIGLPTSLARLHNLLELQVKGCADLKYPPEEVVTSGRDAIINYLLGNMRYEDAEEDTNKLEFEASVAESKAKDDQEAADTAEGIVKPLHRIALQDEQAAVAAEDVAMRARAAANVHKKFDKREVIMANEALTAKEQEAELNKLEDQIMEDEEKAYEAEAIAREKRAEANASTARARESEAVAKALSDIAAESKRIAVQRRIDADEAVELQG